MEPTVIECIRKHNELSYLIISFHQGLSYISELAVTFFFKDQLKLPPAQLSQIMSLIFLPWVLKPLFGLLTDVCPIYGYRRKYYLILCGIVNICSWSMMAWVVSNTFQTTVCLFFVQCGVSFSSVIGEAIVVELSQLESNSNTANSAKDYVSMFFFMKYLGALVCAYLKGLLVDIMSLRHVFLIASMLPCLLILSGCILVEIHNNAAPQQNDTSRNINNYEAIPSHENITQPVLRENLFSKFLSFVTQKFVIIPTLIIILLMSTPSYSDPFFYFLTEKLKFTGSDFGKISFCSTLTTLAAILMYKCFLKNSSFKLIITVATMISFFFSFLAYLLVMRVNITLGISDFWLVLFSNSFLSMLGEITMMPMLSLACLLCPKNLEGTVYSLFMSSLNFGGIISGLSGSLLTTMYGITAQNYDNLKDLILVSNILSLLPLPILLYVPDSYFHPEEKSSNCEVTEEKGLIQDKEKGKD